MRATAMFYFTNSEGTTVRTPDALTTVQMRATGQAPDGMTVRDAVVLPVIEPKTLPDDTELRQPYGSGCAANQGARSRSRG